MSGGATSELIIFIGAILAASGVAGAGIAVSHDYAQAYEARLDGQVVELATDFAIINDARNVTTDPLVIYIKNTGSEYIWTSSVVVFVDGSYADNVTVGDEGLGPGQWTSVTVNDLNLQSGDHTAVVSIGSASDDLSFRVPP